MLFALVAVFGQEVNGAKLWIRIGPVQYEPVEAIKLFIVLFMAGYLAETADVLACREMVVDPCQSQIPRPALHRLGDVDGDPRLLSAT